MFSISEDSWCLCIDSQEVNSIDNIPRHLPNNRASAHEYYPCNWLCLLKSAFDLSLLLHIVVYCSFPRLYEQINIKHWQWYTFKHPPLISLNVYLLLDALFFSVMAAHYISKDQRCVPFSSQIKAACLCWKEHCMFHWCCTARWVI